MLWNPTRQPQSGTTIDSFERASVAPSGEYSENLTDFSIVDESAVSFSARDGTKMLKNETGNFERIYSQSGDGLANYLPKGSEADCWVRGTADPRPSILFGLGTDGNDCYQVDVAIESGDLRLRDRATDTTLTADFSVSYSEGTWYRVNIVWDDGTLGGTDNDITVAVYDVNDDQVGSELTANDDNHKDSEGIGFIGTGGSSQVTYYDFYTLV